MCLNYVVFGFCAIGASYRAETNQSRKYPDRGPGNYLKVTSALVRESLRARET